MAIAKTISLIKSLSGKLSKSEDQVFYDKYGKNFVWSTRGVHSFNTNQLATQSVLAQAAAQVKTIMADSTQLATYETAFKAQSKYPTLRGFIMSNVIAQMRSAQED